MKELQAQLQKDVIGSRLNKDYQERALVTLHEGVSPEARSP
jgi:hypothetical protein